jgi:hypothetical protein
MKRGDNFMRVSLAIILGAASACVGSTVPSHAAPFQVMIESRIIESVTPRRTCYPSIINPILYTCNGQGIGAAWNPETYGGTPGPSMNGHGGGSECSYSARAR